MITLEQSKNYFELNSLTHFKTSKLTVNFHLLKNCNFRCKFCFAHFKDTTLLSINELKKIILELKNYGINKINFLVENLSFIKILKNY